MLAQKEGESYLFSECNLFISKWNKDKLKAKVIEAEIDTIAKRQEVLEGLMELAKNACNDYTRVQAYKVVNDALDSLNFRLGKLAPQKNTQKTFFVNTLGAEPAKLRARTKVYDAIF